ncbi:MAG: helix-turn-helix transcriptional regulator [Candidatus Omnitrophica bacterium]|nr:helix-turn-helix transcriptional regulator [Candidatus Omnitrophota bacterium]
MKAERVDKHLKEKLKDAYFKELYELEEQKLDIVKRIVDYRIRNGLSQKQLAKKVKVTQQHISKIENGEFSSMITLEKVLLAIGYTVRIEVVRLSQIARNRVERAIRSRRRLQFA